MRVHVVLPNGHAFTGQAWNRYHTGDLDDLGEVDDALQEDGAIFVEMSDGAGALIYEKYVAAIMTLPDPPDTAT